MDCIARRTPLLAQTSSENSCGPKSEESERLAVRPVRNKNARKLSDQKKFHLSSENFLASFKITKFRESERLEALKNGKPHQVKSYSAGLLGHAGQFHLSRHLSSAIKGLCSAALGDPGRA